MGEWNEHLLFAVDERGGIVAGELEAMAMSDRVSWTGFNAIAAENTAIVIDVVDLGVAFRTAKSGLGGIFRCFDIDALGWACGRTEKTSNAFLETVFIALKNVGAAKALL